MLIKLIVTMHILVICSHLTFWLKSTSNSSLLELEKLSWSSYLINVTMMMKIVTMMMITHWSPQVQYSRLNEPWKDWKGGSWRPRCCSMQTVDLCPYIMHCHTWYLSFPCIFQACFISNAVSSNKRIIWFILFYFQFYLPRTYPTDIHTDFDPVTLW